MIAQRRVQFVAGTEVADGGPGVEPADEGRHVLLVDEFACLGAALEQDRCPGPLLQPFVADHLGAGRQLVTGFDRSVEAEVLLAVHDSGNELDRHHLDRGIQHRLEHRDDGEDRRSDVAHEVREYRVVGGRGVLGDPLAGHLERLIVAPDVQRGIVEGDCIY